MPTSMSGYALKDGMGWKLFPMGSLDVITMFWWEGSLIVWTQTALCLLASGTNHKTYFILYNTYTQTYVSFLLMPMKLLSRVLKLLVRLFFLLFKQLLVCKMKLLEKFH